MRFFNALRGIRTIRTAKIIAIWLVVIGFFTILIALNVPNSGVGLAVLLGIAVLVLGVTSTIMELVGVSRAAQDLDQFGTAKTALIVALVTSILSGFFPDKSAMDVLLGLVSSISSLVANIFIIKGIIFLAEAYSRGDLVDEGQRLLNIIVIAVLLSIGTSLLSGVLSVSGTSSGLLILLAVVSLVLSLVEFILYLSYLRKTINMLEGGEPSANGSSTSSWGYNQ